MAIVVETPYINGVKYEYTYSDAGYTIMRDGVAYESAYDPLGSGRVYEETENKIETAEAEDVVDDAV